MTLTISMVQYLCHPTVPATSPIPTGNPARAGALLNGAGPLNRIPQNACGAQHGGDHHRVSDFGQLDLSNGSVQSLVFLLVMHSLRPNLGAHQIVDLKRASVNKFSVHWILTIDATRNLQCAMRSLIKFHVCVCMCYNARLAKQSTHITSLFWSVA